MPRVNLDNLPAQAHLQPLSTPKIILAVMTLGGSLLAERHWEEGSLVHRIIACIEYCPFLGAIVALIERVVSCLCLDVPEIDMEEESLELEEASAKNDIELIKNCRKFSSLEEVNGWIEENKDQLFDYPYVKYCFALPLIDEYFLTVESEPIEKLLNKIMHELNDSGCSSLVSLLKDSMRKARGQLEEIESQGIEHLLDTWERLYSERLSETLNQSSQRAIQDTNAKIRREAYHAWNNGEKERALDIAYSFPDRQETLQWIKAHENYGLELDFATF